MKRLKAIWVMFMAGMMTAMGNSGLQTIPYTAEKIVVDGSLTEGIWQCLEFHAFDSTETAGTKTDTAIVETSVRQNEKDARTQFAILHTDDGIYVAVRCRQVPSQSLVKNCRIPDGLYEFAHKDDMIEFFFDFGPTGSDYYWFRTNFLGNKTEFYAAADADRSWNGQWETASSEHDGVWYCESFFPFAGFNRRHAEKSFGLHLARFLARDGRRVTWGGRYRDIQTYPKVTLAHGQAAGLRRNYELLSAEVKDIGQDGKGRIVFAVGHPQAIATDLEGEFQLMRPMQARGYAPEGNGPRCSLKAELQRIPEKNQLIFSAEAGIEDDEFILAQLALRDKNGRLLFLTPDESLKLQHIIGGPGPEYNYYTVEKQARCRYRLNVNTIAGHALKRTLIFQNRIISEVTLALTGLAVEDVLDLSGLPLGKLTLRLELYRGAKRVSHRSFVLRKLAPNQQGSEVKVNVFNSTVEVDGTPLVCVGNSAKGSKPDVVNSMCKAMIENGFNVNHQWGGFLEAVRPGTMAKRIGLNLERFQKLIVQSELNGLKVLLSVGNPLLSKRFPFQKYDVSDRDRMAVLGKVVDSVKNLPHILGYEIYDEPEWFATPEDLQRVYEFIKERDPYHLVTINNCRGARNILPFLRSTDVVSLDYYPIGKFPAESVGPLIDEMVKFADGRPVKFWVQGYKIFNPKAPTAEELMSMTYMAVNRGVTGIFYFIGRPAPYLWNAQGTCAREIRQLSPWLVSGVRKELRNLSPDSAVRAVLWGREGHRRLIAVNESGREAVGEVRLPAGLVWGKRVFGTSQGSLSAADCQSLRLPPYGYVVLDVVPEKSQTSIKDAGEVE